MNFFKDRIRPDWKDYLEATIMSVGGVVLAGIILAICIYLSILPV